MNNKDSKIQNNSQRDDLSNYDIIANSFRTRLDLHGFVIGLFNKEKNILKIIGASTVLSNLFVNTIKEVIFDFNQNKTARIFYEKLKKAKKITVRDLLKLITDNFKIRITNHFITNFLDILLKTQLGELVILPVYKDDSKIGVILIATKATRNIDKQNVLLLESITKEIGELL